MADTLFDLAVGILKENDRGSYTVPTAGLYPFQWNWDSCLTALGQAHFDEARAWTEIETLFAHQWDDGMVPHIVFHQLDDGYFPGPDVWATGRKVPTSGITQPPVAGFAVRRLFDRAKDKASARTRAAALLPKIAKWHDWFYRCRDPEGSGLVAILHPWESGRDNSVDWDAAFQRVPTEGVEPFTRRDTQHANPEHRPTQAQYERYIWLVQLFRGLGWDNEKLHAASPFKIVDPGFNAILLRSSADLADLAEALGEAETARAARAQAARGLDAMEGLWNDRLGQYVCFDRAAGTQVESPSVGGLLAAFATIPAPRAAALGRRIAALGERATYLVPSHDPDAPEYDGKRYWRGPVWLIVNYMIADGLRRAGETAAADRIVADSLRLIHEGGFAEYYDPVSGEPCGGGRFTWTAAMVLEFLAQG
ncbi:MAG: trehalase family glycosidase [Paracoccaceae bacterium]|nr:trehalase family glycosidase [Paracoccaceae bacterium]